RNCAAPDCVARRELCSDSARCPRRSVGHDPGVTLTADRFFGRVPETRDPSALARTEGSILEIQGHWSGLRTCSTSPSATRRGHPCLHRLLRNALVLHKLFDPAL